MGTASTRLSRTHSKAVLSLLHTALLGGLTYGSCSPERILLVLWAATHALPPRRRLDLQQSRVEFDCPKTRLPVRVPKGEWGEAVVECPKGVVQIREIKT